MSNWISGRNIILGAKLASTWRTAVQIGAGDGLLVTGESGAAKAPTFLPDDSLGNADYPELYKTVEAITGGSYTGYLRYDGWDVLLACALGTAGSPSTMEAGAYYNTYSVATDTAGKFVTLAMKKKATSTKGIWEIPSAKITGITVTMEVGQLATITVNFMGNKINNQSNVNTATSMASVTWPTKLAVAKFDSLSAVRMNAQSGAALADSDKIYPSRVELNYTRPFREDYEAGYDDMSEPIQDGFADTTVRLMFNKYDQDDYMDAIEAYNSCGSNDFKMDVKLEGCVIPGTSTRYQMKFQLPKVVWTSATSDASGPGTFPHEVEGRALKVDSAPTGMSVTSAFNIFVVNAWSADPLVAN